MTPKYPAKTRLILFKAQAQAQAKGSQAKGAQSKEAIASLSSAQRLLIVTNNSMT